MAKPTGFLSTTVGQKALMALSGLVLVGFVVAHMVGNLQVFLGPAALNAYAKSLRAVPGLLWGARAVLLVALVAHVSSAIRLVARSKAARPTPYRQVHRGATTYAALTMKVSGPLLMLFILYHLAHLTFPGVAMGDYVHSQEDVYANVVAGFSVPWVAAAYAAAQLLLAMHLYHGVWSMLQSLGVSHPRVVEPRRLVAQGVALVVLAGNLSIPIGIQLGVVR